MKAPSAMNTESNQDSTRETTSLLVHMLPTEIHLKVLYLLDFRTLLLCREVCHIFNRMIAETTTLQYTIELAANGLEDGPPGRFDPAERLDRLKKRQNAWDRLKWAEDTSSDMPHGSVWELYGGVFGQAIGIDFLFFRQLPSFHRGIKERNWTVDIREFNVRDFGMDPSQDLLVICEKPILLTSAQEARLRHSIQLRKLSTGEVHPLAAKPGSLNHTLNVNVARVSFFIQVCANYLGVMFRSGGEGDNELIIWDWKTGQVQLALSGIQIRSFAFLTERHIIVTSHKSPDTDEFEPNLLVYDFTSGPSTKLAIEHSSYLCTFACPTLGIWTIDLDISIRSDPDPAYVPDPALGVPFFTDRTNRLYIVTVTMTDGLELRRFLFFIPSSTLVSRIDSLSFGDRRSTILWDEWGPLGTRVTPSLGQNDVWVCYVYGMRFVAPHEAPDGRTKIRVYDFNPLPIKRNLLAGRASDDESLYIIRTSSLDTQGAFEDVITTSLPYRLAEFSLGFDDSQTDFKAVMCSEDSVLIIGEGNDHRDCRVLTF